MDDATNRSATDRDEAEPVDVVEGPVGSSKLKEPSEVEGSVPSVDADDLDLEVGEPGSGSR
jgi:hypothetical protein